MFLCIFVAGNLICEKYRRAKQEFAHLSLSLLRPRFSIAIKFPKNTIAEKGAGFLLPKKNKKKDMENTGKPNYYTILPADVRYCNNICANAKILYTEIVALSHHEYKCQDTNRHFAELYGVSTVSISKWVSQLINEGFIKSEIIYKEGTKEVIGRNLIPLSL